MTNPRFPRPLLALFAAAAAACGGAAKPAPAAAPPPVDEPAAPPPPSGELGGPPAGLAEPAPLPPIPEAPPPPTPAPPRPHVTAALAMLPAASRMIFGVDVARLSMTARWAELRNTFADVDVPERCRALNAAQAGQIVIGGVGEDRVAVSNGSLDERVAVRCLEQALARLGEKLVSRKLAGRKVYQAKGDDEILVAWTKPGVLIVASSVPLALATLDPRSAKVDAALAAAALRADHGRMLWAAGTYEPADLAALGLTHALIKGDLSWRLGVDIGSETDVDMVVSFASTEDAQAFAGEVLPLIETMRRSSDGFQASLTALQIGVHGTEIHVVARLTPTFTEDLIKGMTERIIEQSRGTPGG